MPHALLVAEAANGKELLNTIAELKQLPKIAILDLSMPDMNGAETAKVLIAEYTTIKVLILSIVTDENSILNLFNIGVHGFTGKVNFTHREISFLKLKLTNLSLKEIAQEIHVSEKTVENYRDATYEKLNVRSRAELVAKLIKMGFMNEDPTHP